MRKLRIGIIDILGKSASRRAFSRYMRANNMSVMPQVVAVWCAQLGHDVSMTYYDGPELMTGGVPDDADVVFINAYSQTSMLAYALSAYFRSKGAVTVLGGPHARSYPDHSLRYFDYALGFCDKPLLDDLLREAAPQRPVGLYLSADRQPTALVSMEERWPFMEAVLREAKIVKLLPLLGSLGCPYTCSFCIDALVPYQPLKYEMLKEDLRFLVKNKPSRTIVTWHDPNFGIRFDDYMGLVEEAIKPGDLTFLCETSFSRLSEPNCQRLAKNGFKIVAPGIESWYDIGDKSKMRSVKGREKVRRIAEHANMITSYIPYMQANLILGLDADEGEEPFELTKLFVDLAPGVYHYFSLLTSYGRNAPDNIRYQREGRVLNIPFHFLNQLHAMNVRPKNYDWVEFFDHVIDVYRYAFGPRAMARRFFKSPHPVVAVEQLFRGASSEGRHKMNNMIQMRERLKDPKVRAYFEGETTELPDFYIEPIQKDLRWLWDWLPKDAIHHDPNAYLSSMSGTETAPLVQAGMAVS